MIEYTYSLFDQKDVTSSTSKGRDRWSVRLTHNPTGLFVLASGVGKYEHQIDARRDAMNELKQQVDEHYFKEINGE